MLLSVREILSAKPLCNQFQVLLANSVFLTPFCTVAAHWFSTEN